MSTCLTAEHAPLGICEPGHTLFTLTGCGLAAWDWLLTCLARVGLWLPFIS